MRMTNCNISKIVLHHLCIPGSLPKFDEQPFCRISENISLSIKYLSILDTWIFHQFISIYHSKSHSCSQVYIVSLAASSYWMYCNVLYVMNVLYWMYCFYFVCCGFETMCRLMRLPTHRLIDSQRATYKLLELQLTTRKFFSFQFP